jgi:hypothetical protein
MGHFTWKDIAAASIGFSILALGHVYLHYAKKDGGPINGSMGANESPGVLYPTCDYWPSGHNGQPCVDAVEHARTGRLFRYWHYPDKPA